MKQRTPLHGNAACLHIQHGLCTLVGIGLVLLIVVQPAYGASADDLSPTPTAIPACPPGQYWDPTMMRCWPIRRDCPAGLIDVTGDGTVCEQLDPIEAPSSCLVWPAGSTLPETGQVECGLPWQASGEVLRLGAAVGCLDISRRPYPRAIVNMPVDLAVTRVIPPEQLYGITFGAPGVYRLSDTERWTTEGPYLHERYGAGTTDSFGQPAFDTRALLVGEAYRYPSLNNVRTRLLFRLLTSPNEFQWTTMGFAEVLQGGFQTPIQTTYRRSSFPLATAAGQFSPLGPALGGANALPAFKLAVRSRWALYLAAEWDRYTVSQDHEYVRMDHQIVEVPLGQTYISYRAWDARQSAANASQTYCNAASGYIPLPVIEAQTVLR